jgi:hypothetical protein
MRLWKRNDVIATAIFLIQCISFLLKVLHWWTHLSSLASKWNLRHVPRMDFHRIVVVVHVDGVRRCLWTAASNGSIVYPPDDEYGQSRWNDTDREIPKSSGKKLSQCHFVHHRSRRTDPGANLALRGERPVTNDLSHCTEFFIGCCHVYFYVSFCMARSWEADSTSATWDISRPYEP